VFPDCSDEVTRVPHGALVTAGNDHSKIQAMAVTHNGTESWYVQYHPEYDFAYYAGLIAMRKERMVRAFSLLLFPPWGVP
jgi:GMP synthase (glutamine-hydrolysing)